MASQGTGYDLSASTYSPDGRIFQIEYAAKAVENAGTAIAIKTKTGVVIAVEKLTSAGLIADGKHIASRARDEAVNHRDTYRYPAPLKALADRVSMYIQAFTLYSSVRPFGISTIFAGIDDSRGPQIFMIEPSGVFWGYNGCAIGKGKQLAKTEIEKLDLDNLDLTQAVDEAAKIIFKVHDDAKDKDFELELSWIGPESKGRHEFVPEELKKEAIRKAKEALDDEMED
ncbi:probable PRE10 - 20S proteasome subunit C1 (alpha7) [Pseudozyma flocculosa]|uniref:Proteasome subunit alpha type n=1 Tax=Pseudozyma flocculosa TaxID=84751 RepID=A0A5C3FC78_9BASI|nr:probable PRE10 - 20S proteasome subunit C1 (alpha7) [Pseudozyma flocculosa]